MEGYFFEKIFLREKIFKKLENLKKLREVREDLQEVREVGGVREVKGVREFTEVKGQQPCSLLGGIALGRAWHLADDFSVILGKFGFYK